MKDSEGGSNGGSKQRKIHILEILGNAITGGMEIQVSKLIQHLPTDKFRVTCLCPYESALTTKLRQAGFEVFIAPIEDNPTWRSIETATGFIRRQQVDLIHAHLLNAHTLGAVVGGLTDTPVVATVHSMKIESQELSVHRLAGTHLLVVCQAAYSQALAVGVAPDKLTLIYNGVDTDVFTPDGDGGKFRQKLGIPFDAPLIGFVGRVSWEKGPDKFLRIAERIRQLRPDAHFVIVGQGAMDEQIKTMTEQMKCSNYVHLAGLWEDTSEVYPALDVFAQTSRCEGMPLSIIEAMSCARPVVAFSVGGVAELVEEETTGCLVSPGDWSGVAKARPGDWEGIACEIVELLEHPARRKQMGINGRRRVEKMFNLNASAVRTSELFQQLVRSKMSAATNKATFIKSAN
jgi:glycosyltransferase involved in cell wall biosynthesis